VIERERKTQAIKFKLFLIFPFVQQQNEKSEVNPCEKLN